MTVSKPDAMTTLFRREVTSLLSLPPPSTTPSGATPSTPIEVLAAIERISSGGMQQSVQLCRSGEETWVTRTEGGREWFPRVGRVQKRVRGTEEDEEAAASEDGRQHEATPSKKSSSGSKKSRKHHVHGATDYETPVGKGGKARPTPPRAPKKSSKKTRRSDHDLDRDDDDDEDAQDDGAATETESTLKRARHLGRGMRKCPGRESGEPLDVFDAGGVKTSVKAEEFDDLASLCGRVGDLGVHTDAGE